MFDVYQMAILNQIATHSVCVRATAGSGKSTLAIEAAKKEIWKGGKVLYTAFNKKIVEEITLKFSHENFVAATMNSYGNKYLPPQVKKRKFEKDKFPIVFKQLFGTELKHWETPVLTKQEINFLKSKFSFLTQEEFEMSFSDNWFSVTAKLGFQGEPELESFYNWIQENVQFRDFDDQIIFGQPKSEGFTLVIIDEAQDLTLDKIRLIARIMQANKGAKILVIGDENQTINTWAGAKKGSMQIVSEMFNCKSLPMMYSYRCPKTVVQIAKQFSPEMECGIEKEGLVKYISQENIPDFLGLENLVLSRTTAKLVPVFFTLFRMGIPCQIKGKEMAKNVKRIVARFNTEDWIEELDEYALTVKRPEFKEMLFDLSDCLKAISEEIGHDSKKAVVDTLVKIFDESEQNPRVVLSTIHKMKGGQCENVFVLGYEKLVQKAQESEEEKFVAFVATSRAKENMYLL